MAEFVESRHPSLIQYISLCCLPGLARSGLRGLRRRPGAHAQCQPQPAEVWLLMTIS
jgi:hypothetical protein